MPITLEELYEKFLNHSTISTDSRQITPSCLFFALRGENFDGNTYAQDAVKQGAAFAVIDDSKYDDSQMLLVDDVLQTLQQLALLHRRTFEIPVIGITGSNGKTTTKELIHAVLSRKYHVTATKGNLNNHIGVPLTLLSMTSDTQIAIIEMGANHQHEIESYCRIAEPTHGMITNIGKAHLEGFGGFEGVIKAKSELYTWLRLTGGTAFVNAGNALLMGLTPGMNRVLYGDDSSATTRGKSGKNTSFLELDWFSPTGTVPVKTNLAGSYNFENAMAAICIGAFFNVAPADIQGAISDYLPSNSRSQAMKTDRNSIILDAYNANPTSMQLAIENFRQLNAKPKMVILGDMLELGTESPAEHAAIVRMVEESGFEKMIFVGPDFMDAANGRFTCFSTSEDALNWLKERKIQDYTILIKGSRGIKMEKVLDAL